MNCKNGYLFAPFCFKCHHIFVERSKNKKHKMKNIVKSKLWVAALAGLLSFNANAQLSDQEYVAVTMDLQGILELNMTTEPQVDFVFNSIQKYQVGITKYNATRLEVESTVPWDLYAQPSTEFWTQQLA